MDPNRTAGRLIWGGLSGPELRGDDLRALKDLGPSGIVLFARNLKSPSQTRDLIAGLRETLDPLPVLVAVDQEGGAVNRMAGIEPVFCELPPAREQARWSLDKLGDVWHRVGEALAGLGFDVDFAPVVDLERGQSGNAIEDRSYGADPQQVADRARAVLSGLQRAGIAGCAKHFPGLGETCVDTHEALAHCELEPDKLWDEHAMPYRELVRDTPMVMTSHAWYTAIDGGAEPVPGSFSPTLVRGWLRDRIGYDGLVISDDLEMKAVSAANAPGPAAERALRAGADLAMFCKNLDAPRHARDHLVEAIERGRLERPALRASQLRLARLVNRFRGGRSARRSAFEAAVARIEKALA